MRRSSIAWLLLFLAAQSGLAEERLVKLEIASKFFNIDRTIQVYLPASYRHEPSHRYPVLYLHDGQNMFSSAGTNICFGWGSWELDKIVDELCQSKKMQEIILVGVKPKPTHLYLDSGVVDFTGGDDGRKLTAAVAEEFKRIGWMRELMHYVDAQPMILPELEKSGLRQDKWNEARKSQHNEFYWRLRVWRALTFLFPPS